MYLLIRRTKEYYTGTLNLDGIISKKPEVEAAIAKWNLKIPYMTFRKEVAEIADLSLNQKWQDVIPYTDREKVESLSGMLLPIDEDDWLHPEFLDVVGDRDKGSDLLTWNVIRKEAAGGPPADVKKFIESCGYAVRLPCPFLMITNHMVVPGAGKKLNETLAIRNETPASVGFLMRGGDPRAAAEKALKMERKDRERMPKWAGFQADCYYALLQRALG